MSSLCTFEIVASGKFLSPLDAATPAEMGARAIQLAVERTKFRFKDIDLIIAFGNALLIHEELELPKNVTPMDLDATGVSFLQALQIAGSLIQTEAYKNIIIVSTNRSGAVAFVVTRTEEDKGVLFSSFETYSEMRSQKIESHIYEFASNIMPDLLNGVLKKNDATLEDFNMVIPQESSKNGHSIPMALHDALKDGILGEGDKVLFICISSGVTLGLVALQL